MNILSVSLTRVQLIQGEITTDVTQVCTGAVKNNYWNSLLLIFNVLKHVIYFNYTNCKHESVKDIDIDILLTPFFSPAHWGSLTS